MDKNKDSILKKRILPVWLAVLAFIVVLFLIAKGWKIVYAPEMENNWTAIDAMGGWTSAIISGLAIWFAVNVPKRIAEKQNDIALFEKRVECYSCFQKYLTLASFAENVTEMIRLENIFTSNLGSGDLLQKRKDMVMILKKDEPTLRSSTFLFGDCYKTDEIINLLNKAKNVIIVISDEDRKLTDNEMNKVAEYCKCCNCLKKYVITMEQQLKQTILRI